MNNADGTGGLGRPRKMRLPRGAASRLLSAAGSLSRGCCECGLLALLVGSTVAEVSNEEVACAT